jgi:hypothetical protein
MTMTPDPSLPDLPTSTYQQALHFISPFWGPRPNTPRSFARRAALLIIHATSLTPDLLLSTALLRSSFNSIPEHSLKAAILVASLAHRLHHPHPLLLDLTLSTLLHHMGQETRGALALSKGYVAQRSLMNFLLFQHPNLSHYRQLLSAFQHDLGMDSSGEPRLDFAMRPGIFPLLLGLCNDFIEALCGGPPNHPSPRPASPLRALYALRSQYSTRYHPLLLDLLQHTLGPAPVGSVIETHTGVRAIILRAFIDDQRWLLHALPLNHPKTLFELSPSSPPFLYLDPQPTLILAA